MAAAVRKAFARYKSVVIDAYGLRGPLARSVAQAPNDTTHPEHSFEETECFDMDAEIQREMEVDPFEMELEIERELSR